MIKTENERTSFSLAECEQRWGISRYTSRRLIDRGELKAIYIGAQVRIPRAEVERVEQYGVGTPRQRKARH